MFTARSLSSGILISLSLLLPLCASEAAKGPQGEWDLVVGTPREIDPPTQQELDSLLSKYSIFHLDLEALARQVEIRGGARLQLGPRSFDLSLEPNDLRSADYRAVVLEKSRSLEVRQDQIFTFRGFLIDDPDAVVRLTISPDHFEGYIRTQDEWIFFDPLVRYSDSALPGEVVAYRQSDVRPEAGGLCGSEHLTQAAEALGLPTAQELSVRSLSAAPRNLRIATEADGQYFQLYGNPGTFNRILSILNNMDGIYETDLNISLNVTYQQAWSDAGSDPYTSLNAVTTLSQFQNWWNANNTGVLRDVAHLFSGKTFSGATVGIAWIAVACVQPTLAYGLSADQTSVFLNTQLTAHEIGHNLAAQHDDQAPTCSGVGCSGSGPILCAALQSGGSNQFSSCSQGDIQSHMEGTLRSESTPTQASSRPLPPFCVVPPMIPTPFCGTSQTIYLYSEWVNGCLHDVWGCPPPLQNQVRSIACCDDGLEPFPDCQDFGVPLP